MTPGSCAADDDKTVRATVTSAVGRLTLDRPSHRNALSPTMLRAIPAAIAKFAADERVRVIELRSALPGMFSAGADIASLADPATEALTSGFRLLEDCLTALRASAKPVVVVVNGQCMGAGCALASAADIVIASEASRFCLPEIHLDLAPVLAMAALYPVVNRRSLALWAATGRVFSALEAQDAGLVTQVIGSERIEQEVAALLSELTRPSAVCLGGLKRALALLDEGGDQHDQLLALMLDSARHPNVQTAVAAFLARRNKKAASGGPINSEKP